MVSDEKTMKVDKRERSKKESVQSSPALISLISLSDSSSSFGEILFAASLVAYRCTYSGIWELATATPKWNGPYP